MVIGIIIERGEMGKEEKISLRNPKIYNPPREEEPKKTPGIVYLIIGAIVLICALSYLFLFSPFFKIREIQIKASLPEEAVTYLNQFRGQNLFLVKSNTISQTLKNQYPQYLDINVYKGIPNILRVEIDEREVAFVWQTNGHYYLVDNDGLAYKEIGQDQVNNTLLVVDNKNLSINIPSQVASPNFTSFIENAKIKIKDSGLEVKNFEVNDTIFQVTATMTQGLKIIFDTTQTLSDQMDAFNYVYKDHSKDIHQYIDLRVKGKVYYQ